MDNFSQSMLHTLQHESIRLAFLLRHCDGNPIILSQRAAPLKMQRAFCLVSRCLLPSASLHNSPLPIKFSSASPGSHLSQRQLGLGYAQSVHRKVIKRSQISINLALKRERPQQEAWHLHSENKAISKNKCGLTSVAHAWFSWEKNFHYRQQLSLESQVPSTSHQKSYSHTTELFHALGLILPSAHFHWPRLPLRYPEGLENFLTVLH